MMSKFLLFLQTGVLLYVCFWTTNLPKYCDMYKNDSSVPTEKTSNLRTAISLLSHQQDAQPPAPHSSPVVVVEKKVAPVVEETPPSEKKEPSAPPPTEKPPVVTTVPTTPEKKETPVPPATSEKPSEATVATPPEKKDVVMYGKNKTVLPSPGEESTFDWTDVDLTEMGSCGYDKCFFPSRSNATIGYLLANSWSSNVIEKSIVVAKDLEARFNAKHFHVALQRDQVDKPFREYLNTLVHQPSRALRGEDMLPIFTMSHSKLIVIETVIKAPAIFFFMRTYPSRCDNILAKVDEFLAQVDRPTVFHEQLQREYDLLLRIWADNPVLVRDFQAMIDTVGNLYYIDLDGHIRQQHAAEKNGHGNVTTYYHQSLKCLDKIMVALQQKNVGEHKEEA